VRGSGSSLGGEGSWLGGRERAGGLGGTWGVPHRVGGAGKCAFLRVEARRTAEQPGRVVGWLLKFAVWACWRGPR